MHGARKLLIKTSNAEHAELGRDMTETEARFPSPTDPVIPPSRGSPAGVPQPLSQRPHVPLQGPIRCRWLREAQPDLLKSETA